MYHFHFTEHPGWRLESKIYPELNDPEFHPHAASIRRRSLSSWWNTAACATSV
ncbi:MAG: hypothetical protein ACLT8E_11830 [Akkermansia sp.]